MNASILTERTVLMKTKLENLDQVKNLNLWGNGISDVGIIRKVLFCIHIKIMFEINKK